MTRHVPRRYTNDYPSADFISIQEEEILVNRIYRKLRKTKHIGNVKIGKSIVDSINRVGFKKEDLSTDVRLYCIFPKLKLSFVKKMIKNNSGRQSLLSYVRYAGFTCSLSRGKKSRLSDRKNENKLAKRYVRENNLSKRYIIDKFTRQLTVKSIVMALEETFTKNEYVCRTSNRSN